jgi:hypothetical protein
MADRTAQDMMPLVDRLSDVATAHLCGRAASMTLTGDESAWLHDQVAIADARRHDRTALAEFTAWVSSEQPSPPSGGSSLDWARDEIICLRAALAEMTDNRDAASEAYVTAAGERDELVEQTARLEEALRHLRARVQAYGRGSWVHSALADADAALAARTPEHVPHSATDPTHGGVR